MSNSWLDTVVDQHIESEAPKNYWMWAAMAAMSAILKDKIWMDRFYYKLYPNIYVMLYGPSGIKKGPPVNMARQLVTLVNNTRVIDGRSSIQGILKKLSEAETKPGGLILNSSSAFICSSEMAASIVEDPAAITILTDIYDRNYREGQWQSLLKSETFNLKDVTVSLLGATNEAQAAELFSKRDVNGGFFARTNFIYETKPQTRNSLMRAPKIIPDYKCLAEYLKELSRLSGEIKCSEETIEYVDNWYIKFWKDIEDQNYQDETGTVNRYQDSVLKIAILLSLSESTELIVKMDHAERAISYCERLLGNVRKATLGTGSSVFVSQKKTAIMELIDRPNHIISRAQLHKKFWMHASLAEWNEIMAQLEIAGMIRIETVGNQVLYRMNEKEIDGWQRHFEGK